MPPAAAGPRRTIRLAFRIAAGAAVLLLVIWYAHPAALWAQLRRADPWLFTLAVLVSIASNALSAMRWAVIARGLGLIAPTSRLVLMYARAITTNMLLPGATLSGDLLRSVQLSRLGNPFVPSALSVFLDRFSGLWVLCVLSLLSAARCRAVGRGGAGRKPDRAAPDRRVSAAAGWNRDRAAYPAAVRTAGAAPASAGSRSSPRVGSGCAHACARRGLRCVASVWQSLGVQALSAATLWICAMAVGRIAILSR